MKVLWLTNYVLPFIASQIGIPATVNEGWLIGLSDQLIEKKWEMVFCTDSEKIKEKIVLKVNDNTIFYGFPNQKTNKYNKNLKIEYARVLATERPDIIHIMGSEFPHAYSMYEACVMQHMKERCVVSIQGLISKISKAYDLGIEPVYKKRRLFWDLIVKDSILLNKKDFAGRGFYEKKLLENVCNVIGRTKWDRLCVEQMNDGIRYFTCKEILRAVFYQNRWSYQNCTKHSVIISQATYPVKGFHILLKAAAILKKKYHDLKIYVPSHTVYPMAMKRPGWLNSDYANYIVRLIEMNSLKDHIEFLGSLDAESMCRAYLRSNVFVCPSTIENSSNSLGEAMLLGMPVVASYVGGLSSMMDHEKEGIFFPLEEEYTLAACIGRLFEDIEFAERLGENAQKRAETTHNREENLSELLWCYNQIYQAD